MIFRNNESANFCLPLSHTKNAPSQLQFTFLACRRRVDDLLRYEIGEKKGVALQQGKYQAQQSISLRKLFPPNRNSYQKTFTKLYLNWPHRKGKYPVLNRQ